MEKTQRAAISYMSICKKMTDAVLAYARQMT